MSDYEQRTYLSSTEAAKYLGIKAVVLHELARLGKIKFKIAASGQKRFDLKQLMNHEKELLAKTKLKKKKILTNNSLSLNHTIQRVLIKNSMNMSELKDESVHMMVTSPPYFNAKMYSKKPIKNDLGNIHNLDEWFDEIGKVWKEVYRVLQPGRKAFVNIMNLPIRDNGGFRTLNLTGKTIDLMEKIGFIFKRDIVWHKTNGVRAQFGTYPYPGGILINNMHEFILEFNKPEKKGFTKYAHLSRKLKEDSKIDKDFWLSLKNSDVWTMKPQNSGDKRSHVAPFPYELPYRLIKAYSYISETVLDPFLGSGITLKAAADLRRNGVGYELVPEIAEEAIDDLKNFQTRII